MRHVNRIADREKDPSREEIERACRAIRSTWSDQIQRRRRVEHRIDPAHTRAEAQLRFLRFLLQKAQEN